MTSSAYKKVMWGILLSGCHLIIGTKYQFQILPAFIGYLLVWLGLREINAEGGKPYYEKVETTALFVLAVSGAGWIAGIFFGYYTLLSEVCMMAFYLLEWLLYADLLNKSVKLLKEQNRIREADTMRKNRMRVLKLFLGVIVLYGVEIVFQVLADMDIFKTNVTLLLPYAVLSLMLAVKLWISIFLQNLSRYEITIDKKD